MFAGLDSGMHKEQKGEKMKLSEESKRISHNSVEKKRKDRLKLAIHDMRKIIPISVLSSKKSTHCDVLEKAREYIRTLEEENKHLLKGDDYDVRAEIIAKLRKEKEELAKENQQLIEIIEAAGSHLATGVPVDMDFSTLTANWKTRTSKTLASNSEILAEVDTESVENFHSQQFRPIVNNFENSVELTSNISENLTKEPEVSTVQGTFSGNNNSSTIEGDSSFNFDKLAPTCESLGNLVISTSSSELQPVAQVAQSSTSAPCRLHISEKASSDAKKPRRTISHYLSQKKNLVHPVVTSSLVTEFSTNSVSGRSSLEENERTGSVVIRFSEENNAISSNTQSQNCSIHDISVDNCLEQLPVTVGRFECVASVTECSEIQGDKFSARKDVSCSALFAPNSSSMVHSILHFEQNALTCVPQLSASPVGKQLPGNSVKLVPLADNRASQGNQVITAVKEVEEMNICSSGIDRMQTLLETKYHEETPVGTLDKSLLCKKCFAINNKCIKENKRWKSADDLLLLVNTEFTDRSHKLDKAKDQLNICRSWQMQQGLTKDMSSCREDGRSDGTIIVKNDAVSPVHGCSSQLRKSLKEATHADDLHTYDVVDHEKLVVRSESLSKVGNEFHASFDNSHALGSLMSDFADSTNPSRATDTLSDKQPILIQVRLIDSVESCFSADNATLLVTSENKNNSENISVHNSFSSYLPISDAVSLSKEIITKDNCSNTATMVNSYNIGSNTNREVLLKPLSHECNCVYVLCDSNRKCLPATNSVLNLPTNSHLPGGLRYGLTNAVVGNRLTAVQPFGSVNSFQPFAVYMPCIPVVSQPSYSVMLLNPLPSNSTVQTVEASSSQQLERCNKTLVTHAPKLIQNCHGIYAAAMAQRSHPVSLAASSAAFLSQTNSSAVLGGSDKTLLPSTSVSSVNDCSNPSDICLFSSEPIPEGSGNTGHDIAHNPETVFTTTSKFSVSSCSESDDASKMALAIASVSNAGNVSFETAVDNFDSHTVNKSCALETSDERIDLQNETAVGLSGLNAVVVSNDAVKGSTMGFVERCAETCTINESVSQNIGAALSGNDHCAGNASVSENQENVVGSFSENSCQSHPYENGPSENDSMEESCVSLPQKIPLSSSSDGKHATESYSFIALDSTKQLNWQSHAVDDGKSSHMYALKSTEWDSASLESAIAPELSNESCQLQSREMSQATDPAVHSSGVENDSQMPGLMCLETRGTNVSDDFLKEPSCSALAAKYFVSRHSETSGLFDNIASISDFGRKLGRDRLEYQEICHHSKGQADMMSPFETNKLIHPPLTTQEHWNNRSYQNFLPGTYNSADTEPSNKSILTMDIVRGSSSQNRTSNVLCDNIQPSKGNKRLSKTSKIHKKRCTTKVGLDMEINNDALANQETDEVFSHNISNFKEYNLQNYVAPPISHFLPESSRATALIDAEKAVEFKETYQNLHSEADKNKILLLATDQMTYDNTKAAEKQVIESFNEDSSNVLPELNFPDNEDFPCISLDDMVRIIDPNPVHGRTSSQSRSTVVGHWHHELYDSSKKGKLRDKQDSSRHRHDDDNEIDRYAVQSRQDLFNISADGYSEQDDLHSTAVDDFNGTMQNQKTNASTFSSWQLPAFSNPLSVPGKCTYHSASNKMCSSDNSSNYAPESGQYSSSERLNFVSRALSPVSMANSRSKNMSSSGIFCLAQHAVPEKSSSSSSFMPGYCHDFLCAKEVPSTCSMNSHSADREQSFSDRGRNFPDYNFPSYGNDYSVEKPCKTMSNSTDNCLWSSYGSKHKGKRGHVSSSSHSVVPTAPVLSFRPQVEVEYSNTKPRTKDTFVHVTSSFLSHIATEKDGRHSTTLAASVPAVDNLAYGSWNDRIKDPGFLSTHGDPWRGSYCSSSTWKLGANDTAYCQSSRAEVSAVSSVASADLAASSSEQFHFSISSSGLTSTTSSLPPFSLSCLPMDHGSFAFNLSSVTDMPSAESGINSSSCSQERRNMFLFYPLEHNDEDLHSDLSSNRPPLSLNSSSQGVTTNFSFEFCDMPDKSYKSRLSGTEDLHQKRKSEPSPNINQAKPLPSFFNIASYGLKDKMPVSSCSETFYPKEFDSLNLSHGCASSVAYSMPFPHTSYAGSCSLNSYPQNFYHHSTFPVSLTSPPLHHHPPLADRCLNSEQQPRFDSSFPLRNLQFPPVLNFVHHPLPPPPTFDAPPMVPFQSQIVENLPAVTDHEKLDFRMFHMNENRNSKSGIAYNDQPDSHTAITGETHSLKSGSKRSSRNAKKKHATLHSGHILEASQNTTPYFPIPNFSPSKNCNQDIPAYISNNPFRGETGSAQTSFNHTGYQSSSSFNPLLPVSQGSLNLHQPVTGFTISTTSSIMPSTSSASVLPPIHNFGFPNFFSDLSNPTVFGGDGISISPVKLPKGVSSFLSTSTTMNSSLHHQPISQMSTVFSNRSSCSPPPSTLHNLSINSLLSNQHQRFDETRTVVSSTNVSFVTGEIKSSTFGLYRP